MFIICSKRGRGEDYRGGDGLRVGEMDVGGRLLDPVQLVDIHGFGGVHSPKISNAPRRRERLIR